MHGSCLCRLGDSNSDDDTGDRSRRLEKDASASNKQRLSSADGAEEGDTLNGGSTSTAQPLTDAGPLVDGNEQQDELQPQGSGLDATQAQPQGQFHPQAQSQGQSQSQGISPVQPQAQSQSLPQSQSQGQSQSQTQSSHPATHSTELAIPFHGRLAASDGAQTELSIPENQLFSHAGQHSAHFNTHTQDAAQLTAENTSPGPDQAPGEGPVPYQATNAHLKLNQATQSCAQEAQGSNQLPAGAFNNEGAEGYAKYQHDAADPMAAGQTLTSNLAFQQELQQRSSERDARAGALTRDRSDGRQQAEGGVPYGQDGGQRNHR